MAGIRVTGFWPYKMPKDETKEFYEAKIGGVTLRIFWNDYRKSDKEPILVMYASQAPIESNRPKAAPQAQAAERPKSRITPRPQVQQAAIPTKPVPAYVDHTQGGYGVGPDDPVPWPEGEDLPF